MQKQPWVEFYARRICDAKAVIESPEASSYERLVATEAMELDQLKAIHNERRNLIMDNGTRLEQLQVIIDFHIKKDDVSKV